MLAALLVAAQISGGAAPIERSPRLRRTLPNGASIGAEARPDEARVAIQAVLSQPEGDRLSGYGHRHLLEHLIAARDPELDRRVETVGGALGASTGRDFLRLWVSVPPDQTALGLEVIRTLLRPIAPDDAAVARERALVRREAALLTGEERAGRDAWRALYGEAGLDPIGGDAALDDATPASLARLWQGMLAGPRLSLFAAGPLEPDAAVERLERIARTFPGSGAQAWSPREPVASSVAPSAGTFALAVGAVDDRATLAALAAALALASEVEGSAVTYTPSVRGGAILLQNQAAARELGATVRRGDTGLRNRALNSARLWLAAQGDDALGSSELRATLAALRSGLVPERVAAVLAEVREGELDAAFARWREAAR